MADAKNVNDVEEVRLDKKVTVKSIAPWPTGTKRKTTSGDIMIAPNGTTLLTREEIISQGQNGNRLLNGLNGDGDHATWFVEDEYVRRELGYDTDEKKQEILTKDAIKKLFDLKTQKAFEDNIRKKIRTRAEKGFLMEAISSLGINDFKKITFCIEYTGIKLK